MNLRKEIGITMKSKETSSQLELGRNSYVTIVYQLITVSSNICKKYIYQKAFSSTATRFNPYFSWYGIHK